jgi:hypothetical protein
MHSALRIILLLFLLLPIVDQTLRAQFAYQNEHHKDLLESRLKTNLLKLQEYTIEFRGNDFLYVPLSVVVLRAPQSKPIPKETLFDLICLLNEQYEGTGIQFFIRNAPTEIQSNALAQNPMSATSIVELKKAKDPSSLNLFITESDVYAGFYRNVAAYYSPKEDWVVAKAQVFKENQEQLIAHEIGHYFSLLHTFHGWESAPFDYRTTQRPPYIAPDNKTPVEWQPRLQCQTSGDFLCDTPPDYNFGLGWVKNGNTCAPFDAVVQDPEGNVVSPMQQNFMSYFIGCADYQFTEDQIAIMQLDYKSDQRAFLRTHGLERRLTSLGNARLLEPNAFKNIAPENVFFQWEVSEGADNYLLSIKNAETGTLVYEYFTPQTSHSLSFLQEGRYRWSVMPLHATNTCASFENSLFFTVEENLSSLGQAERNFDYKLFPNVVGTHDRNTRLFIKTEVSMQVTLSIVNVWGATVQWIEKNKIVFPGESSHAIPVENLPSGVYFLKIDTQGKSKTIKLFIS